MLAQATWANSTLLLSLPVWPGMLQTCSCSCSGGDGKSHHSFSPPGACHFNLVIYIFLWVLRNLFYTGLSREESGISHHSPWNESPKCPHVDTDRSLTGAGEHWRWYSHTAILSLEEQKTPMPLHKLWAVPLPSLLPWHISSMYEGETWRSPGKLDLQLWNSIKTDRFAVAGTLA